MPRPYVLPIRLSEAEIAAIREAAKSDDRTVSEWAREVLRRAAARKIRR